MKTSDVIAVLTDIEHQIMSVAKDIDECGIPLAFTFVDPDEDAIYGVSAGPDTEVVAAIGYFLKEMARRDKEKDFA